MPTNSHLKIAVIAHVRFPIGTPYKGGMESHTATLTRGLLNRGHDVTLFASGDSDSSLPVHSVIPVHYETDMPWQSCRALPFFQKRLDAIFKKTLSAVDSGEFDIVHNNSLHPRPHSWAKDAQQPMVTSLHIPPFDTLKDAVLKNRAPWLHCTVTSHQQMPLWWDTAPVTSSVVYNGIDLNSWRFSTSGNGEAVWFGRIVHNKGAGHAVRAAKLAGVPLTLFGVIEERDFYDAEVAPYLDKNIRYGGHLDQAQLAIEIRKASALLFTPMWSEPFGLAAAEAMACGLPVAAFDNGAAREVIGPDGYFAQPGDDAGLAQSLRQALTAPRRASRDWVEARYSIDRMIDGYERVYQRAIAGREISTA